MLTITHVTVSVRREAVSSLTGDSLMQRRPLCRKEQERSLQPRLHSPGQRHHAAWQVNMTTIRTWPEIGKVHAADRSNPVRNLLGTFFCGFATVIFVYAMSGTSILAWTLCFGIVTIFSVLIYRNKILEKRAKEKWRTTCTIAWLNIVDRLDVPAGGPYVDGYGDFHSSKSYYRLDLEMNADQNAAAPDEKTVEVKVNESTYNSLLDSKTVCIYYQPETPLTFFLEEELSLQ
jgi:hypothetical protein